MTETLTAEIVAAEAELKGPSPDAWFDRLDADQAGLDEALAWSLEHDLDQSLRLAGAVWPYWLARARLDSGRAWLAKVLAASEWGDRTAPRAKALYGAGTLAFIQGDREPSLRMHTESLAIARELGDQGLEADALIGLARVAVLDADAIVMEQNAQRSLEAARAAGDAQRVATALHHVVEAMRRQRRYEESLPLYNESIDAHRALGDERGVALELHNLGNVARLMGDKATAEARYRESLALAMPLKSVRLIGYCFLGLAHLAGENGDWSRAAHLLGASAAAFEKIWWSVGSRLRPRSREDAGRRRGSPWRRCLRCGDSQRTWPGAGCGGPGSLRAWRARPRIIGQCPASPPAGPRLSSARRCASLATGCSRRRRA